MDSETYFYGPLPVGPSREKTEQAIRNSIVFGTLGGVVEAEKNYPPSPKSGISRLWYLNFNAEAIFESLDKGIYLGSEHKDIFEKALAELYERVNSDKGSNEDMVAKVYDVLGAVKGKNKPRAEHGEIVLDKLNVFGSALDIYRFKSESYPPIPS